MGCRTELAAGHIALVLQRLLSLNVSIFFENLRNSPQKKLHAITAKKIQFFFMIYKTYCKKKLRIYRKKNYTTRRFFVHNLHFSHFIALDALDATCLHTDIAGHVRARWLVDRV